MQNSKICKIICFDEESVTDYLQIVEGGELEKTTELLTSRNATEQQDIEVGVKFGLNNLFKAITGLQASTGGSMGADLSFSNEKLVKNIVKNTLLTDFINVIEKSEKNAPICKFKDYELSIEKDSLSYIVMISPYLGMMKSGTVIPAGDYGIAIEKMERALKNAKGYYEFVAQNKTNKVILRFNINSFRNSYTISDLLKMDLSIYAIKVGKTTVDKLAVGREFGTNIDFDFKDNPSYHEKKSENDIDMTVLDVYDVLLAGIEINDK